MSTAVLAASRVKPARPRALPSGGALSDSAMADPYAALVTLADAGLMRLYVQARRNASRIVRTAVALLPLIVLMVSSCKTAETASTLTPAQQVRQALVPDHAAPAQSGRARAYVAAAPETLTLLTTREIGYLYGRPAFVRKDDGIQVWQYKTEGCLIDFYMYGDKTGADAVSYVDVRRDGVLPVGREPLPAGVRTDCLRGLSA